MKITEGMHQISLSTCELKALHAALKELDLLKRKYPNERNGYDLNTQETVRLIHLEIVNALKDDQ